MVNTTAAAASIAAISGLAAYLNGKYHIAQDLGVLEFKKQAEKYYAELGMFLFSNWFEYVWVLSGASSGTSSFVWYTDGL